MTQRSVMKAVADRLEAGWDSAPIIGANTRKAVTPPDGSPYVLLQYPYNTARQLTFGAPGANVWREEGGIRFVLNVRRGAGLDQGFQWAEEIARLFRGKEFDGVQTFAPTSPVIDDENDDGAYFVMSFVVPYQFDLIG